MPAATSDVNLLFGMLALQLDFITRDQLLAGMNAWVLDKGRPLGRILQQQGVLADDRLALLDSLVTKHLEVHGNDASQSLAAIGRPIAQAARDTLDEVKDADLHATIARVCPTPESDTDFVTRAPAETQEGTRFRIVRPHAKGGLGVVFVAVDQEIGREVALKEIQIEHSHHNDSRLRFVREAEITGGLEHPGIVPVYGLGRYPDGRPYYAMRFIRGESLKEAVDRHRGETKEAAEHSLRQILGRFVDVCNAIDYAHSKGVLHRDLKPGNIMMGKFGETLVVDWGLAKAMGRADVLSHDTEALLPPSSDDSGTATQMGSAVGTPAFMSPEQAAGRLDQLGPASDVYSLGATLYYILTGRAPFDSRSLAEVLNGVQKGDFPQPRQIDSSIPRPLEAICLKAMALSPKDRYATATGLRRDVENWLDDIPVTAWSEPVSVKIRRGLNRHRLAAGMVSAAVMVATIGLAVSTGVLSNLNNQLAELNDKEAMERRRAEDQVVALFLERGQLAAAKGDRFLAALAYVEAIAREADPKNEELHRTMLASLLDRTPTLEWWFDAKAPVRHASFSPDGSRVVVAAADGSARVVRSSDGTPIGPPLHHDGPVTWTAFSPDGTAVATASADKTARVWNATTGASITGPLPHTGVVNQVHFDKTGKTLLTAGGSSAPLLWDAATGAKLFDPMHKTAVPTREKGAIVWNQIAIGGTDQPALVQAEFVGDFLLTLSEKGFVRLLPADQPYGPPTFETLPSGRPLHVAFDPRRRLLSAACESGEVLLFDDLTPRGGLDSPSHLVHFHDDGATVVAFDRAGGRVASGGMNLNAAIDLIAGDKKLSRRTGRDVPVVAQSIPNPPDIPKTGPKSLPDRSPGVLSVPARVSPEAARAPDAGNPGVLSRSPGSRLSDKHRILYHSHTVHRVAYDPRGKFVLTASEDQTARLWSSDSGEAVTPPLRHGAAVRYAAWSPDGLHVLTCGEDGFVRLWNVSRTFDDLLLIDHQSEVNVVAFSATGDSFATATDSGDARLWNSTTGKALGPVLKHPGIIRFAALNPAGTRLATSCSDRRLRIWDVGATEPSVAASLGSPISDMSMVAQGRRLVTASDDGTLILWNVDDGSVITEARDTEAAGAADLRSDYQGRLRIGVDRNAERFISAGMGQNVRVWDGKTGKLRRTIATGNRAIHDVDFAPDGKRFYTAGTHGARVWDVDTGAPVSPAVYQSGNIYSAAFSPDGKRLATAGSDGFARIWDATTGEPLTPSLYHDRYVHEVGFSSDGRRLLTVCANHVRVWDAKTGSPLTYPLRHGIDEIPWAEFDPAGGRVASAGRDGTTRIWTLPPPESRTVDELRSLLSQIVCVRYSNNCQLVPHSASTGK